VQLLRLEVIVALKGLLEDNVPLRRGFQTPRSQEISEYLFFGFHMKSKLRFNLNHITYKPRVSICSIAIAATLLFQQRWPFGFLKKRDGDRTHQCGSSVSFGRQRGRYP